MTTTENIAGAQPRLKARYRAEIKDALNTEFAYENVMQIPGVVKVVVKVVVVQRESRRVRILWRADRPRGARRGHAQKKYQRQQQQ